MKPQVSTWLNVHLKIGSSMTRDNQVLCLGEARFQPWCKSIALLPKIGPYRAYTHFRATRASTTIPPYARAAETRHHVARRAGRLPICHDRVTTTGPSTKGQVIDDINHQVSKFRVRDPK